MQIVQVEESNLSIQVFFQLDLIPDIVHADSYLAWVRCRWKVLIGTVFELSFGQAALLFELDSRTETESSEGSIDFGSVFRVV